MGKRAILAKPGPVSGSIEMSRWITPDYTAGDAQFLDDDPKRFVQLRPILKHEQHPGRFFGPSDLMLVARGFGATKLRGFVRMRPGYRANTPRNIALAIQQITNFDPALGAMFRMAHAGRDPFAETEQTAL